MDVVLTRFVHLELLSSIRDIKTYIRLVTFCLIGEVTDRESVIKPSLVLTHLLLNRLEVINNFPS